ncbi:tetraprenyl-beta-curcumene synthase family protein [Virgibacillus saliphilus]|uniref:tetraprenyl-beta-curcumene synthase family protein n=1 Tax=Virgibacillus saliphilus TaxID=2831674 RepID=UPI00272A9350|nr:tetraprenyl-beta-curcumene synthase family protein [Virgibacillus sp. NKC19-3]
MAKRIPTTAVSLMNAVYRRILPAVDEELSHWKNRAIQIPNAELRTQALASIEAKRFHCQGGAVYALLADHNEREAIRFIVAYQTISDYLDNLCDRSTSMDPEDFRLLHEAMHDALTPGDPIKNYYERRNEQRDGEYLADLVRTCQKMLRKLDHYSVIEDYVMKLEGLYADLQVHKHVKVEERIPRLTSWYDWYKACAPGLSWYEFSAAAGSTLGIFCLVSYALGDNMNDNLAQEIYTGYFPYMQGLHILLDYYIDQQEDIEEADLNFCSYYSNEEMMRKRLHYFIEQSDKHIDGLSNRSFHKMIYQGLVGLYLGDPKVKKLDNGISITRDLLRASGYQARFFHWNTRLYYKYKR